MNGRLALGPRSEGTRLLLALVVSSRRRLVLLAAASVLAGLAGVAMALVTGSAVGLISAWSAALGWRIVLAVALGGLEYGAIAVQQSLTAGVGADALTQVRQRLIGSVHDHGERLGPLAAEQHVIGLGLIEAEQANALGGVIGTLISGTVAIATTAWAAVSISGWLAMVVVVAAALAGTIGAWAQRRVLPRAVDHYDATQRVTALMSAVIEGRETVGGLGLHPALRRRMDDVADSAVRAGLRAARSIAVAEASGRTEGVLTLGGLAVVLAAGSRAATWDVVTATTATALVGSLVPQLGTVSVAVSHISMARAAAGRLATVIHEPTATAPTTVAADAHLPPPATGTVVVDGVWVGVPQGPRRAALADLHLDIPAGRFVVVCGPSGAGKSLLLAVVRGAVTPTRGVVRVSGHDPAHLAPEQRSHIIGHCEQHPFLFDDDLPTNVAVAQAADWRSALTDAAAGELPVLFGNRSLGPRGRNISGGQRRRVALARALATRAQVLTLDDPTGSLDRATESRVAHHLRSRGSTVIAASNSPALAAVANLVILLDSGCVIAAGTDTDLRRSSSQYRRLMDGAISDHVGRPT